MIDFRYHLVSLISVFMALAVGIVLGAGPLKGSIGDALTGEVEALRTRSSDLRTELDATRADLATTEQAVAELAPSLLEGTLTDRRVALVQLDDVPEDVRQQVRTRLEEAGATVTAVASVTETWTDPARQSFRAALAGTLLDHLDPVPGEDVGTGVELAEGLVQGLTTATPDAPDVLAERAGNLLALLTEAELVRLEGDVTVPADHVVLLAGPTRTLEQAEAEADDASGIPEAEQEEAAERRDAVVAVGVDLARAAAARTSASVVVGGELAEPSVVRALRQDDEVDLPTVDSVTSTFAQVAVPLVLAQAASGTVVHAGIGGGAEVLVPARVVAPPPERTSTTEPDPDAPTDGATAEPGGTDEG